MLNFLKKFIPTGRYTTSQFKRWWVTRDINWNKDYLQTYTHPHRDLIIQELIKFKWLSLFEVGCASGPNLVRVAYQFPNSEIGGIDINPQAVQMANAAVNNIFLQNKQLSKIGYFKEK